MKLKTTAKILSGILCISSLFAIMGDISKIHASEKEDMIELSPTYFREEDSDGSEGKAYEVQAASESHYFEEEEEVPVSKPIPIAASQNKSTSYESVGSPASRTHTHVPKLFHLIVSGAPLTEIQNTLQRLISYNFCGKWHWTPLHCAAANNRLYIVEYLVKERPDYICQKDAKGRTALDIAKECNCPEIVKFLEPYYA